ncbi:nicotinate-nucleotide--dimethylbenzimidazole phosphoribosyltransferase [Streptomyces sp. NPDC127197]|uniref:nicotinate-nucleotide--dimethylbenzimidazole phosphoribosyltransferase n=1 Tax=Streptomyces sp. NPDC127197 TaxID=3345388 RepID=UPI00362BB650
MTDTGQVPGEGLPENAGMVEQPGVLAPGAYTYLSETPAEDEDLLLPGAQGAWGNEVAPPPPEPVVEAVHEPDAHEMSGRDSGAVDLGGVRLPDPTPPSTPAAPSTHRRPLHLGPPVPDASASPVRSLADRGPAGAPARQPSPPTVGPEYLDVPRVGETPPQGAVAWGGQAHAQTPVGAEATPAETVVPTTHHQTEPVGAAQAAVARLATEAVGASGHSGAYAAQTWPAAEGTSSVGAGEALGGLSESGGGEPSGTAFAAGSDQAAVAQADGPADQVPGGAEASGAGHGDGSVQGAGAGHGDGSVPATGAGHGQATGAGHGAGAVQSPDAGQAAAAAEIAGADSGQFPDAGTSALEPPQAVEAAPAPDGTPEQAMAASEVAQLPETVAPESASETGTPEAAQAAATAAHDAAQAPATAAPDSAQTPATAAPDVPQASGPEQAASDVLQVSGAEQAAPDVLQVSGPEQAASVAPQAAEPEQAAPDAPQAPVSAVSDSAPEAPAPAQPLPDTAPGAPAVTDAAQPQPTDAHPAPAAATSTEPSSPQPPNADQQQALQTAEATPPVQDAQPGAPAGEAHDVTGPSATDPSAPLTDHTADQLAAERPVPQPEPTADAAAATPAPEATPAPAQQPAEAQSQDVAAAGLPSEPQPDQPVGQFVPVEGSVPTTPHLAPTPPHPVVLPTQEQGAETPASPEPVATVPAPREADTEPAPELAELVQHAEDLDTRAADQEEGTAEVAEARQSPRPAAPPYDDAEREAVLKVMRERRDIRNGFRSDPIPHEVLLRVLEAAHTAPSVGHSQPWDFVVIRSAETRRAMLDLAMRQRDAYAKSLPKGRAKQFKELKIEAILDTPVNIVVTADPTRGGRHTLGRHTQPQMAPYSSALAVENLWLAARAEGLGVGWVSFFDEREMVRALGLPEHLEVVAYLCVGYVDEFPDEPELMQAGWSKRRPLSWVVHEETYGRRALPGEEPHDLLGETVAQIRPLDAKALGEAWERQKRMTKPAGALGMLEIISAQLSGLSRQCPPPIPEPAAVAIFAGDHGVHAQGVTPWPQEVTAQMVANFLGGGAVCNAFANQVGAEVCIIDVGVAAELPATPGLLPRKVRPGTADMTTGPAMTREEARQAIEVGIETARDLVSAGNKALLTGEMGIANTTASAALISVFTDTDPAEVTGRGTGINDETLARKTEVVRRAIELHQPDPADPIGVLAAIGGLEHAAMVGLLLGGASLRTPVILDGVSAGAAALVARAIAPEVLAACIAGHRSAEPGHVAALNKLGLRPLVDLDLRLGEGTGALLALPMVQSTARAMHEVATFDSAGVTEK